MKTDRDIFGLGEERVEKVIPIVLGTASQDSGRRVGDLWFLFCESGKKSSVFFENTSSVLFYDEVFCGDTVYPYRKKANFEYGLYECIGSSYLERLREDERFSGGLFKDHRHFVYFDDVFCWHITATGVTVKCQQA